MFERLVQQILSKFLSKYFTEDSLAKNKISRSTQLGVWSGYISLHNLQLKNEVINATLQSRGLPFEIIDCSFRQVEITIPWAKLSNPMGSQGRKGKDDAVVVVVMDGIHLLARTNFDFDDVALRREEVKKRRQALADPFRKVDSEEGMSYREMLKQRLKDGLLQDIASKVHVHLRDMHIRLEDIESDPLNPYACGITLESMHIQHDDTNETVDGVVAKMAQLNHLSMYWNALSYESGMPAENAVLHQTFRDDSEKLAQLLDSCIARRASLVSSPSKNAYMPTHTYLLLPVDGMWHGRLSTNPKDLSSNPTIEMAVSIDPVFGQLRDYQVVQILGLLSEFKNHKFVKRYRQFRPLLPVMEDPKAWWLYATRAIRFQLRESFLRSSWARFTDVLAFRNRYMGLFERSLRFPSDSALERTSSELDGAILSRSKHSSVALDAALRPSTSELDDDQSTTPDEGAGPCIPLAASQRNSPLTPTEYLEMQDMEDGLFGGLSVGTVLLCRALVHSRLGRTPAPVHLRSLAFLYSSVKSDFVQDSEAKAELETLLEYLDKTFDVESGAGRGNPGLVAVSVAVRFEELNLSLLSPLPATAGDHPLRQIHDKFLELSMRDMQCRFFLKGDYEAKEYQLTMQDLVVTEIRGDKSHHVVLKQVQQEIDKDESYTSDRGTDPSRDPLMAMSCAQSAKTSSGSDVNLVGGMNGVELTMVPECEWIFKCKAVKDRITKIPNVADYWKNLSFAYVNSLALGRLGLVAKAESAGNDHKNFDVDIRVRCPVLRIGDGKNGSLIVDLGIAQFKTVRLAAKPSSSDADLWDRPVGDSSGDTATPLLDDGSVLGSVAGRSWASKQIFEPPGTTRRSDSYRRSSALSVDSRTQAVFGTRSVLGSAYFDEPATQMNPMDDEGRIESKTLSFLFYDVFSVHLQTGKITLCGDADAFDICCGFEVSTVLKKSVLPADHTLCQFKAHTVLRNIHIDLRRRVILATFEAFCVWKALLESSQKLHELKVRRRLAAYERAVPILRPELRRSTMPVSNELESIGGGSASVIDENEFFDAHEHDGSLNGDNSAVWFEENWISDAESYIDSDSRSGRQDRRRRRRGGSVSDMSSVSDQSAKEATARERKAQQGNAYLSAENLARLEEGASEDESLVENLMDMDDASFHSVMSEQGQKQVLRDLEETIDDASKLVDDLCVKIRQLNSPLEKGTLEEGKVEREDRRSMQLRLGRARAELRGLRALRSDMVILLSDDPIHNSTPMQDSDMFSMRNVHAKNAKALLAARRRRNLMLESNGSHSLTKGLNREVFQGSLLFQQVQVTLHLSDDRDTNKSSHTCSTFDVVASQTGLAIFHQVQGTKVYFSSDQVSATFFDKADQSMRSLALFSGGNADTFLPSHFPHLVSRSMEDKFFRGSLHLDKRGSTDMRNQQKRVLKVRLVIGDVEVFPSKQILTPLVHFFALVERRPMSSPTDAEAALLSDENGSSGVATLALPNEDGIVVDTPATGLDVAFRLSSIRLIMSSNSRVSGAVAATETALRLLQVGTSTRQKMQVDVRCTNFQILQISSHEAGHGSEIMGRRDVYNPLIQMRTRSQITPSSNLTGWVVGGSGRDLDRSDDEEFVRNLHVGLKLNPLAFVATPAAIFELRQSIDELKSTLTISKPTKGSAATARSLLAKLSNVYPLRWRVDFSLKRLFVNFPERAREDFTLTDEIESRMKLGLSFVCCIQESSSHKEVLSIRAGVTEIAITRPSDDWQILEPVSILFDASLKTDWLVRDKKFHDIQLGHLKLDPKSPLNEISVVLDRYGWDPTSHQHDTATQRGVIVKVTPTKGNISSQAIGLIADVAQNLKVALSKNSTFGATVSTRNNSLVRGEKLVIRVVLDDVELELRREQDSRPGSQAISLLSFTMTDVRLDFERGEQIAASILIRNSALYDLSSSRGVQVVGESLGNHERDTPYFVRAKLYMDRNLDGPTTTRLEINWGSLQCLVLPAFLVSVLSFKDDVLSIMSRSKPVSRSSSDVLGRLEGCEHDINLILTAHADAFECILSSKDIPEYIRQNGTDTIGVVALRWKASLSLSLALDTLRGVSLPWLTLNLDGKFADEEDISLFKDFISRYLSVGSGPAETSEGSGQKLRNVCTSRVGLVVSGFQVIRTTIAGRILKSSLRTVSYKSATRICFVVTPPSIGEQRVTNPIDVDFLYRGAGATMSGVPGGRGDSRLQLETSQLLEVKAQFVDVLLYISQSSGGFTESFKTTVKPILEIFKEIESRRKRTKAAASASTEEQRNDRQKKISVINILERAPTMCLVKLEGFQVTCVPGGATRLNESPILKMELNRFSSGLALGPLSIQRRGLVSGSSKNLLAATDILHTTVAGWVVCDLSGHYHNSRLVAWEPFVEPWTADVKFGIDAVDAFGLQPVSSSGKGEIKSSRSSGVHAENHSSSSLGDAKGDRLRDFGRLFRAPFQSSLSVKQTTNDEVPISHPDFCYLMLASMSRTTMLSVMYGSKETTEEKEARLFSRLPTREKLDWLVGFGFPGRENGEVYAASCVLTDSKPLNINVTGALLENVLGYLHNPKARGLQRVAPHWIRNDTGMTVRFQEVLDGDRTRQGEEAGRVVLPDGAEVPLTLQRSLSQTCDPHRAYIYLEVGSFEDTVGRIRHEDFDIPKGALSSSFLFKASAKIPVDTVGFHRYPLDRNSETRSESNGASSDSRALGWIIVRVALRDGIKVVSVESPFVIKSTSDANIVCEVRSFNGLSLLWRCLVPKPRNDSDESRSHDTLVSIPADIVPFLHDGSYSMTVFALPREHMDFPESELPPSISTTKATQVHMPPPFSPQSFTRGLIREEDVCIATWDPQTDRELPKDVNLTVCSFRIGNFYGVRNSVEVPEQRMIMFRAPLAICNRLALPVAVQVRVKAQSNMERNHHGQGLKRLATTLPAWEDLGVLECGESVNWTGARASDKVQLRVRFVGTDGDNSRKYPDWSSVIVIPTSGSWPSNESKIGGSLPISFARMRVLDAENVSLSLSVAFDTGINSGDSDPEVQGDIRTLSRSLAAGSRAVSIFVPYWIIDSTNQDLEFFSGMAIAGQLGKESDSEYHPESDSDERHSLGLAELLDNANFLNLPSSRSFDVFMLGDQSSTRLMVRKRPARQRRGKMRRLTPPWSDPIPLQAERPSSHDITVLDPKVEDERASDVDDIRSFDRFILRSRVVAAPERFGGRLGTKLVHVVNRYSILNETGRDVEVASEYELASPTIVRGTGVPHPFHFDDNSPMRLRFKEFGWSWSGKFNVRRNRTEVTMRLRHKMKGLAVIVTVELVEKKGGTNMLVLRQSSHPPFRLENQTMFPLLFGQSSARISSEETEADAMLLPYQSADFAWDEPELRRRILILKTTDNPSLPQGYVLGRFQLDKIAPGTVLSVEVSSFTGEIVADGPTRVLRITDSSMPSLSSTREDGLTEFHHWPVDKMGTSTMFSAKLLHGIGISVVDWSPQELLYIRLEDIHLERKFDGSSDIVNISTGNIKLNNQLWVTPYPVLLMMGRRVDTLHPIRRKNRRHDAIALSWKRSFDTHGSFGNVTLLERVEVSSEPIFVNVDGQLVDYLVKMLQMASRIRGGEQQSDAAMTRDETLRKILSLPGPASDEVETARKGFTPYQQTSDGDLMTTAAVASKLKAQPLPFVTFRSSSLRSPRSIAPRKETTPPDVAKPQHKYYIEKLRISATKADLSWSGPLPGLVSSLLLRALTFESLPVRLRPYSSSHVYGNAKDHLQSMKSHYLSVWRVLDLLIGLSYNPTFLFRAIVYTSRETFASILESWAADGRKAARKLEKFVRKGQMALPPTFDDGTTGQGTTSSLYLGRTVLSPFARGSAAVLNVSSAAVSFAASLLKVGSQNTKRLATKGMVRSRNPRLFAHMDGRDLLVEYVEGENAGKALLSRVRMGMHLGEGYIFHSEGVKMLKAKSKTELDPAPLIVMVTSERTMLLHGKLDWDFCAVAWEATLENIVHMELIRGDEMSVTKSLDEVVICYLSDSQPVESSTDEKTTSSARTVMSGVSVLHSTSVFLPHGSGTQLITKMAGMDKRLADHLRISDALRSQPGQQNGH